MTTSTAVLRPTSSGGTSLAALFPGAPAVTLTGVTLDSRAVLPGDLYVALPGGLTHGARFATSAVASGALAVLTDPAGRELAGPIEVPVVAVSDPRAELAKVAAEIYGWPARKLAMFAVTGTTGKTSTSFLVSAGLTAAGHQVGTIGTIGFTLGGERLITTRSTVTTPEAPDLQALLGYLLEHGADSVAMEVSSHALALNRVDSICFDVAAFTNLGRDHLDFHRDQEDYFQAKAKLFRDGRSRAAVINTDDSFGQRLAAELAAAGQRHVTTGISGDYRPLSRELQPDGSSQVRIATPAGELAFRLGLLGDFNLKNATTAVAMLDQAGVDLAAALPGLAEAFVPGRMQRVDLGPTAPGVVVDFAHTPEAVTAALAALPAGRRIAVLGCGGDRDPSKRGPMGAAAARGAEVVVVTDDNPRSESPAAIRAAVLAGAREAAAEVGAQVLDGGDRADAIRLALDLAGPQDWVAILGKGHETGQQLADRTIPFDDVVEVATAWLELNGAVDA